MAEVVIEKRPIEVLEVNIEGKKYSIPLGGSLPYGKLKKLTSNDAFIEFFKEYIPEKVFDSLYTADIKTISDEWSKATKATQGSTLGE